MCVLLFSDIYQAGKGAAEVLRAAGVQLLSDLHLGRDTVQGETITGIWYFLYSRSVALAVMSVAEVGHLCSVMYM